MTTEINAKDDKEKMSDTTGSKAGFWGTEMRSNDKPTPKETGGKSRDAKVASKSVRDSDSGLASERDAIEDTSVSAAPKHTRHVAKNAPAHAAPKPKRVPEGALASAAPKRRRPQGIDEGVPAPAASKPRRRQDVAEGAPSSATPKHAKRVAEGAPTSAAPKQRRPQGIDEGASTPTASVSRQKHRQDAAQDAPAPATPRRRQDVAQDAPTSAAPKRKRPQDVDEEVAESAAPKQEVAPRAKKAPLGKVAPTRPKPQPSVQAQRKEKPKSQVKSTAVHSSNAANSSSATGGLVVYGDEPQTTGSSGRASLARRILCIVGGVVVVLVAAFAFGVWYFSSHYLPNTYINGLSVSSQTVDVAQSMLEEETSGYVCAVSIGDFSAAINGADVQIERDEKSMAVEAMEKQSPYTWPIAFMGSQNVEVDAKVTFDEDAVQNILTEAVDAYNEDKIFKANASIEYDDTTGLYEVVFTGDTHEEMLDGDEAVGTVLDDVKAFNRESCPPSETCVRSATAQDIPSYAECVAIANEVLSTDIPILVYGDAVTYSYASTNAMFLSIVDGPELFVDQEQIRAWAENEVADAVFHMDEWAYYLLDVDQFVEEFTECLLVGDVEGYEAPTYVQIRTEEETEITSSNEDWNSAMGRYIDVNLSLQFARLFDESGTVIWESAFVSGDVLAGNSTVTGVFSIYSMQTGVELVGLDYDGDGEPDYVSYVNYWMPFYEGYGFHDATWRSDFGGDYYYGDGSHGCVNLPYSKAEELFAMTYVGETVNVHW